jgi:hypothetical protein
MRDLFNFLDQKSDQGIELGDLTNGLSTYVTPDRLAKYLLTLAHSAVDFNNGVRFRHRHQLGFEKYVLYEAGGAFPRRVRMHVWKAKAVEPDIHNHGTHLHR